MTSSNTKLNILLNNTNKALIQVLMDATSEDLKLISKDGIDLKSIMSKILKSSEGDVASNKAILNLVKNNPTLNNLGDATTIIKELIKTLKSEKNPLPIEKVLEKTLIDIKDVKSVDIKPKIENSGIFLESKIKNLQSPIKELKTNLTNIKELLSQSKSPQIKEIVKDIELLVKKNIVKNATSDDIAKDIRHNPKRLEMVSKDLKAIVEKLQKHINNADPIHSSKAKEIISKLEFVTVATKTKNTSVSGQNTQSKQTTPPQINISKSEMLTQNIEKNIRSKVDVQKLEIGKKEPKKVQNTNETSKPLQTNEVKQKIQIQLPAQTILNAKTQKQAPILNSLNTQTQTVLLDDASLKSPLIKESLQTLQSILDKSLRVESKPLLKTLKTILTTINSTSSESTSKETKQDLSKLIQDTKQLVQKADVSYSKDVVTIFSKLKNLTLLPNLSHENRVKEMLGNDLKATLMQTTEELQNSSNPNKHELIKQMDKLSLQIDYYQLISHLSNGTSVYLPITWDQLEGGNLDIKKDKDKFYCDIELDLKDYGEVFLKLTLFEKNQINIHVYSKNQELKNLFQENLSILRGGLIGAQIVPREIRFHDAKEKKIDEPYVDDDDFKMGFEVKG